jgi:chromosome segregation ATPase
MHKELKETSVIVQTNAEGIAFLGQQAMLTAKKDDLDELRTSVDKTAERTRKETDALKAATQASFEELEGRTKKLERGARKQSESPKPSPAPADGTAVTPQAVSALESRMAKLEAATPTHPNPPMDAADVSAAAEKYESTARELTARVERLQEAVGVEMLSQMKRMDAKLKTVEISLGEVKQQGVATQTSKQTSNSTDKPGKLDKVNAQRLASAEKAAAESRSTAEDAAEKAKLASEKAKAALAAVAEHAATAERVKEAEARMKDLATEIEKFRADVAEMEVSSATNTADVVAIEGEWASARRHLKDLEQSVWKSMVMIREETGVGTPSSDAGAGTPATPATGHGDDATAATPAQREAGRTPETPMSGFRALFSRGRRTNSAPRSAGDSESARRLRARQTASPERSNTSRSEALIEALDMGSPTRPARRSANRGR